MLIRIAEETDLAGLSRLFDEFVHYNKAMTT
jgi:hypothetical protein